MRKLERRWEVFASNMLRAEPKLVNEPHIMEFTRRAFYAGALAAVAEMCESQKPVMDEVLLSTGAFTTKETK